MRVPVIRAPDHKVHLEMACVFLDEEVLQKKACLSMAEVGQLAR